MRKPSSKKPGDVNQLAKLIVEEATVEPVPESVQAPADSPAGGKNPAAVALGRLGGLKGGRARAEKLTKEERSQIAANAAAARWAKHKKEGDGA